MANFLVFLGGVFGLICGAVALFLFDLSILAALGIWSLSGLVLTLGLLFWLNRPNPTASPEPAKPQRRRTFSRFFP